MMYLTTLFRFGMTMDKWLDPILISFLMFSKYDFAADNCIINEYDIVSL